AEAENRAANAGAELAQSQKEKTELQTKLVEKQNEIASLQKRIEEAGTANPSERLAAASTPEKQPTPTPPSLKIKAEPVEETTPPPRRPKRLKTAPVTPPQAANPPAAMSISSAKALAIYAPRPDYPRDARSRRITGSGVCVLSTTHSNSPLGGSDSIFCDEAEKTVLFVGDTRSKINSGAERKKIPQAIDLERRHIGFADRLQKSAGRWIVIIDRPVTKIANPEFTLHQGKSPRGIEFAIRDEAPEEGAAGVEHIHEAVTGPGHIILPLRIL